MKRRKSLLTLASGLLLAGALVVSPTTGASAAEPGDGGRFDTWAGYQVGRFPVEALAGDFNSDGAPDVAWVSNDFFHNTLSVTLNLGDGTLGDPRFFVSSAESATDGVVTDLNGDGNLDIATVSEGSCLCNDIVDLYLGDGTGNFAHRTATAGDGHGRVAVGDLDADGDPDLALTNHWSETGTVSVLLNDGDATFAPEVSYPVGVRPLGIVATDIDGDDDLDLVAAASGFSAVELAIYPLVNSGDGTLIPAAPQEIDEQLGSPVLAAGNLDGDGDEDLALGGLSTDASYFLFNGGTGSYAPVPNRAGGFSSGDLEVIDLEPDGDIDVVSATFGSSQAGDITVFRNAGGGAFIAEQLNSSQQPTGLAVADFTGDGVSDIAAANRGSGLGIIHAGGTGGVFPVPPQTVFFQPPFKIATGDLDGDGDTDIAATTSSGSFSGNIQILLNDGTGTMVVGASVPAGGPPSSIDAADLDLDGDDDLVWQLFGFSFDDAGVALSNGDGTFAAPQLLNVTGCGPGQVTASDMDGDADADILIANRDGDTAGCNVADSVTIVPSNGDGTFGTAFDVTTEALPEMAIGADMNGDGLNDLVTAHPTGNGGDIAVSLNLGAGSFAPHVEIDSGVSHFEVAAADLDSDGDTDLATVDSQDSATVFTNDGSGTGFSIDQLPGTDISGLANAVAVDIGDIDGDGRPDVVVANWTGNDIGVWFNNADGTFQRNAIHYGVNTGLSDLQLADFDGDGLVDVAVPNTTTTGFAAAVASAAPVPLLAAPNGVSIVLNEGAGAQPPTCTIRGTAGNDILTGTPRSDVICCGGGDDIISGGAGNDVISGGAGNDIISGDGGNDALTGGDGNDRVRGNGGNDLLLGGGGFDVIVGGSGDDRMDGGASRDGCDGGTGTDRAVGCQRSAGIP